MSVSISIIVKGTGVVHVLRNGSTLGDISPRLGTNIGKFTFEVGDTFEFRADQVSPTITFVKWTNSAGAFTTANPFTGTITTGGDLTAHFSDESTGSNLLLIGVGLGLGLLLLSALTGGKR